MFGTAHYAAPSAPQYLNRCGRTQRLPRYFRRSERVFPIALRMLRRCSSGSVLQLESTIAGRRHPGFPQAEWLDFVLLILQPSDSRNASISARVTVNQAALRET